ANGVIKGAEKEGILYLNPQNNAMRSECSQMLSNFLYIEPVYEINGNDLSLYKIVYNENEEGSEGPTLESAQYLAGAIKHTLGIELPIVNDTEVYDYEILVGRTAREDAGLVSVDRESFKDDQIYVWSVQGNRLVIAGIDSDYGNYDDRSGKNVAGTRNAVFNFCMNELGFYEYSNIYDDDFIYCEPDPVISLDDGYYFEDMTWYRMRTFYMQGSVNGTGGYSKSKGGNISEWITGDFGNEDLYHEQTPCMSDKDNLAKVIENVRKVLSNDRYKQVSVITIGINDTPSMCLCADCKETIRTYKAKSATLALFVNAVCEAVENEYPEVKFQMGAYGICQKPPVGITMHDNVMIEFYTVANCSGHAYEDTSCSINKELAENLQGWDEIAAGEIVVWDHTGGFIYFMTPQADWDSLLVNVRFFAEANAREMLMNSVFYGEDLPNGESPDVHADLGNIRAYMLSMIYMDPFMSQEEFYYRLNACLKANYGDGWKYIRAYIDIISELGNSKDHSFHAPPSGHYDYSEVSEKADYINSLWENAKALAEGDEYTRLVVHETSWIYLYQCATYDSRYTNGTEEQRAEYVAKNQYLLDSILNYRLHWTEGTLNLLDNLDVTVQPNRW
ncbi:MAG: DUF4838 domain-containing protein, partial [Clostridia bacterium]|nr:DUF4838 domain-containing protein [Clostridia bacterium]